MLFAVAAVGCGCAEPHVFMLHRTIDVVATAVIDYMWICRT
jgi:hypothetical protein